MLSEYRNFYWNILIINLFSLDQLAYNIRICQMFRVHK